MVAFQYAADIGTPSYRDIETFARKSGIGFSVTSTTTGNHAEHSYHYTGNAIDVASSAGSMISLAQWLYGYAQFMLELIHSGGPGFFVKNGQKVGASYYGAATVSQHYNHVHIAMTESGLRAAAGVTPTAVQTGAGIATPGKQIGGCLIPSLLSLAGVSCAVGSAGYAIYQFWF